MPIEWIVLIAALWAFALFEGLLLLGVIRQVGILHRRIDEMAARSGGEDADGLPVGAPAPDFTLPQDGAENPAISLRNLRGRPLLLAFLDPGCEPCRVLLPHLQALAACDDGRSPRVLLVHRGSREERDVARAYRVRWTPCVYAIGADGTVRGHRVANTGQHLEHLAALAKGEDHG